MRDSGHSTAILEPSKLSPSQFMRALRPEYYSDTEAKTAYVLDAPTFSHHLDTITSRNQTNDFELFCRKLCERTICPNLRPQTGPEGGGDSKADTETYPVADEVSATYIGVANSGREKWAFAFSAKKTWGQKVRSDVVGLIGTGRGYDKIFCVTSRFARAKDRAALEDELSSKFKLTVTILDRSWIIKNVIDDDRRDLACNYLGVGQEVKDTLRLGPSDYSRTQQLFDIEKLLDDPDSYRGMEAQLVSEALVAAKLSRGLERPRIETEGRLQRARSLAGKHGSYRQQLQAWYEAIWTAFWYFDDTDVLISSYGEFEEFALKTDHAANLEFLCNLYQLLVICISRAVVSRDAAFFDKRSMALSKALSKIAEDKGRPNNALDAKASLCVVRVNIASLNGKSEELTSIWKNFANLLDDAKGMGEFDARRLISMIEAMAGAAGTDPEYNLLIEKLAAFVGQRTSEGEGALILLKRARTLGFSQRFDMIRLLGRAAHGLSKQEYASQLIEALQLLSLAYRSAGLLWAARATCVFCAGAIVVEGEKESELPIEFVTTMKLWALIALQLKHVPDFIFAVQMLNATVLSLPLAEESKAKVKEDILELDYMFGCMLLNLNDAETAAIEKLPDILSALGLFTARAALLYSLGYLSELRADGSVGKDEPEEDVKQVLSRLASQPVAESMRGSLILNQGEDQRFETTILGMEVIVSAKADLQSILVAQAIVGTIEAFFATVLEHGVAAHTETFHVDVALDSVATMPRCVVDEFHMSCNVTWPSALAVTDFSRQADIQRFLAEVSALILGAACFIPNAKEFVEKLFAEEAIQERMGMIPVSANSHNRIMSRFVSRLDDWAQKVQQIYPARGKPTLSIVRLQDPSTDEGDKDGEREGNSQAWRPKSHRDMTVRSLIDVHAWNKATWRGIGYAQFRPKGPFSMALLFEDREGAIRIFERWKQRLGDEDANEEIYLSIVRNLPHANPHHYVGIITSSMPAKEQWEPRSPVMTAARFTTMTPSDSVNLDRFLRSFAHFGTFLLMPAIFSDGQQLQFLPDLAIRKRSISVKKAAEVQDNDLEVLALGSRRHKRPDGV
jgi:hypothetical protein